MAHFAQINEFNLVIQVIVIHNNELMQDGVEQESKGIAFCRSLFGANTNWKQTSYNGRMRKNYAGIGFIFDADRDAFIPPKQFESWVLDEETCNWSAPAAYPNDGKNYRWDEPTVSWVEVTNA